MSTYTPPKSTLFNPSQYRRTIAEMFSALSPGQQTELLDGLALIPRHIHRMALDGRIAAPLPKDTRLIRGSGRVLPARETEPAPFMGVLASAQSSSKHKDH